MASPWTKAEVEAELKRRAKAERDRDDAYRKSQARHEQERANAICLHCGNPFISYSDFPLCDACLGD
jgi:hypothetical protein